MIGERRFEHVWAAHLPPELRQTFISDFGDMLACAKLTEQTIADDCQHAIARLHAPYWPKTISEHVLGLEAEIAKLRALPGATAMTIARKVVPHILRRHEERGDTVHSNPRIDYEEIARAIESAAAAEREKIACEVEAVPGRFRSEEVAQHIRALGDQP